MAVYREGYHIIEDLVRKHVPIFPDAADIGVPVSIGDKNWNAAKQLVEMYGVEGTRQQFKYSTGMSVEQDVELMDEWAVSDERKTEKEATDRFKVIYIPCKTGACEGKDGFIYIYKKN